MKRKIQHETETVIVLLPYYDVYLGKTSNLLHKQEKTMVTAHEKEVLYFIQVICRV